MLQTDSYDAPNNIYVYITETEANGDSKPDLLYDLFGSSYFLTVENGVVVNTQEVAHGYASGFQERFFQISADLEPDGDIDVVTFDQGGGAFVMRRVGPTSFVVEDLHPGGPATDLADIDADGDLDGICCGGGGDNTRRNQYTSNFEFAINDGTDTFAPSYRILGLGAHHIAGAEDIDSDGDLDIVAGRCVLWNDGVFHNPAPSGEHPEWIEPEMVNDCDGDGDPDYGFGIEGAAVTLGDGSHEIRSITVPAPPEGDWRGPGVSGDFDGDGDVDLLVSRGHGFFGFQQIHLLANNGAGALYDAGPATDGDDPADGDTDCRDQPTCYLVADLEGDGDLDFVSPASRVYLNDGTGFFTSGEEFPGEEPEAALDLNNDGLIDLVTDNGHPMVRLGTGGGSFGPPTMLLTPIDPDTRIAYGDFDGNGGTDIALVIDAPYDLAVHWNDGNAQFTTEYDVFPNLQLVPQVPGYAAAADIDRDGVDDLFFGPPRYGASSYVVHGKKGGGWGVRRRQVVFPTSFVDVDGDGDLDGLGTTIAFNRSRLNPDAGVRHQYGDGSAGTCSPDPAPILGASGPFRPGSEVVFRMSGIEPGSIGLLTVGTAPSFLPDVPWVGTTALNWPWLTTFVLDPAEGQSGVDGSGRITRTLGVTPPLSDLGPFYYQAFFPNSCDPAGYSATNGLKIDYGF